MKKVYHLKEEVMVLYLKKFVIVMTSLSMVIHNIVQNSIIKFSMKLKKGIIINNYMYSNALLYLVYNV